MKDTVEYDRLYKEALGELEKEFGTLDNIPAKDLSKTMREIEKAQKPKRDIDTAIVTLTCVTAVACLVTFISILGYRAMSWPWKGMFAGWVGYALFQVGVIWFVIWRAVRMSIKMDESPKRPIWWGQYNGGPTYKGIVLAISASIVMLSVAIWKFATASSGGLSQGWYLMMIICWGILFAASIITLCVCHYEMKEAEKNYQLQEGRNRAWRESQQLWNNGPMTYEEAARRRF